MKNISFSLVAALVATVFTGCQTAPMTAKSRLSVSGEATVVERTTTIAVDTHGKTTTNVVERSIVKSPAAGDLEIKNHELDSRRDVGVARAGFWDWFWTPTPVVYGGGYYYGSYGGNCFGPTGGASGGCVNYAPFRRR